MRAFSRGGRAAVLVLSVGVLVAAVACTSKDEGTTAGPAGTGPGTTVDASVLGTPNKATGTPLKIGLVDDGKTDAIDHTALVAAFRGTASYIDDYLGGFNGHPFDIDECATNNTPSGATTCGVQMANDKVAAAFVVVSSQDGAVFDALEGTGIPYITYSAANQDIILKPGAFIMTNPVAALAAPAKYAKDKGLDKVGSILIDVPAATGPITAIATPIFKKAGVGLDIVTISPQTADMTPQIQQAISNGDKMFVVTGTDAFAANAIKTAKQLGFQGPILLQTPPTQAVVDGVPGGLDGILNVATVTTDPNDKDVKLYNAILAKYAPDAGSNSLAPWSFSVLLAFEHALAGDTTAVDPASITKALGAMPKPMDLPMAGGIQYQCGAKFVSFSANICVANVAFQTLDAQGKGTNYAVLDVSQYMSLGG
jgi:branched-chain amino acid transport system substrate-binding protein